MLMLMLMLRTKPTFFGFNSMKLKISIFEYIFGYNTLKFKSPYYGRLAGFTGDELKIGGYYGQADIRL